MRVLGRLTHTVFFAIEKINNNSFFLLSFLPFVVILIED